MVVFIHTACLIDLFCVGDDGGIPARCLSHSFALHTHYEVAPPYPPFVPHISMVCPGLAVFNTGDSLVAVDIRVDTESCCDSSSMQFTASCAASDLYPDCRARTQVGADDIADDDEAVVASESVITSATANLSSSSLSLNSSEEQPTPKDATNILPAEPRGFRERNLSSGKENELKFSISEESPVASDQCQPHSDAGDGVNLSRLTSKVVGVTDNLSQTACNSVDLTDVSQASHGSKECLAVCECPWLKVVPPRLFDSGAGVNIGMYPSFSRGLLPDHVTSSNCSSLSSPVILQNDTQCLTYSVRRYSPTVTYADVEGNQMLMFYLLLKPKF